MRPLSFIALPLGLFVVASAAPTPVAVATPTCSPYNYPQTLNTTQPSAFFLSIRSTNPQTNGRNIQLRSTGDSTAPQIAVIDSSSPVLLSMLRGGTIFSQNRTIDNQLYDLGPTAQLKNVSTTTTSSLQEVYFVNATETQPPATDFQLTNVSEDAQYNLYHVVTVPMVINGFTACQQDGFWQLYYYTYMGSVPNFGSNCEYVAVQATVAPAIPW